MINSNIKVMVTGKIFELDIINFVVDSNFYYKNNLKLFYFLIHAQCCSVSDAARALGRSRAIIYDKILPHNPSFESKWGAGHGRKNGSHQRTY